MPESEAAESRVSMNWPNELKGQVRDRVGARGLTTFTLDAVREKLAREPGSLTVVPPSEPRDDEEETEVPDEDAGNMAPPVMGVAAQFSRSGQDVVALMEKARALGIKSASELSPLRPPVSAPTPPAPVAADPPQGPSYDLDEIDAGF